MNWYYHENSDMFFIALENSNFGSEAEFVSEIGEAILGTEEELRELLIKVNHFAKNCINLNEMIAKE